MCVREIKKYFRDRFGTEHYQPNQREVCFVMGLLVDYGEEQLVEALKYAPSEMRHNWPEGATIFAIESVLPACLGRAQRRSRNLRISALFQRAVAAAEDGEVFQPTNDQDKNLLAEGSRLWERSSPAQKNAIAQALVAVHPALRDLDWLGPILQPVLWARALARNAHCEELGSGS